MNWLVNHGGKGNRPYWMNGTSTLYFGPLLFGGQLVEIDPEVETFRGVYPGETSSMHNIRFHKVLGLRKSEMGKVTHKSHPHKIQHATAADKPDVYREFPRGTEIFHPVWDSRDWPPYPHGGRLYIAEEFLEFSD
jgi:hypothetical protein